MNFFSSEHHFRANFQQKQQKREEIKRLKNLKKKEIFEKLQKLKEITGQNELFVDPDELDKDFDPADYDKKMKVGLLNFF